MFFHRSLRQLTALVGFVGIIGASLSGCGGGATSSGNGGGNNGGGSPDLTTRDACKANGQRAGRTARWTVLVYMNAANNLQPDSLTNIAQMANAGSDSEVNIVVQWKQAACAGCGTASFVGTRRYRILKHNAAQVAQIQSGDTSPLENSTERLGDPSTNNSAGTSDMGDRRVLQEFIRWGTQTYPADNLCVVLWDHGSGWQPTRSAGSRLRLRSRAFSQDDDSGNEIEMSDTPPALSSAAQPIDVLAFDCSLMQMIEVAYELRSTARVLVGSEESPPGAGYPYDQWLAQLKSSGKNPCDLGRSIINTFVANYPNNGNITQSLIDLSKMDNTALALDDFSQALRGRASADGTILQNARQNVQSYAYPDNKDLYHYAQLVKASTPSTSLQQAATNMQNALTGSNGCVLIASHGRQNQDNSNGLAIYIPDAFNYLASYSTTLALSRVTHWDQFLQEQVK